MAFEDLTDIERPGLLHVPGFADEAVVQEAVHELDTVLTDLWDDVHMPFRGPRGDVEQNYFNFAHSLSDGSQEILDRMLAVNALRHQVAQYVSGLGVVISTLQSWEADELSINRYDRELGLDFHRDPKRFWGVVPILALQGVCTLAVKHQGRVVRQVMRPTDLGILRAPGLFEADIDAIRPDHAVLDCIELPRTSLMLRASTDPSSQSGFKIQNLPRTQ